MTILTSISTTGFALFSLKGIFNAFEVVLASAIIYAIGSVIYNIFFHPLRHIPGPLFARSTGLCFALHIRDGSVVKWIKECHDKYGDAVRLEPNEVSFISGETAWQDIYGHKQVRNKNAENFVKDLKWFPRPVNGVLSLLIADEEGHPRQRRNLSHAFSDKALRGQESLIQSYVDLLVRRLGEHAAEDEDIDMRTWYNFTTFDIISDLTFGEPLYCLRDSREHHWIFITLRSLQAIALHVSRGKHFVFRYLDFVRSLFTDNTGPMRARYEFAKRAHDMVSKRLEKIQSGEDTRPDFFTHIIKNQDKENTRLTRAEMDSNAVAFLIAGSETSATALAGATYLLLRNPQPYKKLVTEIRSRFSSADQITVDEVNKLDYLIAVFQEALRYYPPAATGLARVVPAGGDRVSGYYVPGGASVYVSMHAMGHSERNYRDPDAFVPERWLGDERYKDDKRAAHQPFSFGPRNCIGKTLAHAETRLILTKVLFAYDLELVDKETNWMDQKVFALWDKGPMMVKVKPAQQP